MKIKFMYENNGLLIFLRLNGIAKIKNAIIKILHFGSQIAKISNRRKYPLYGRCRMARGKYYTFWGQKVKGQGYNGTLSTLWF